MRELISFLAVGGAAHSRVEELNMTRTEPELLVVASSVLFDVSILGYLKNLMLCSKRLLQQSKYRQSLNKQNF